MAGHGDPRPSLSYSIQGMSARDELLIKSFVRLLNSRCEHNWRYSAQTAQLHMMSDSWAAKLAATRPAKTKSVQPILVLGDMPSARENYLCMPLRVEEVLGMLNLLGSQLASSSPAVVAAQGPDWETDAVRLVRWPPAQLLGSLGRMRLATLLTGKPLRLADLQQRSGQPLADCTAFLHALGGAGLLRSDRTDSAQLSAAIAKNQVSQANQATPPAAVQKGLLARIRNRLGIFSLGKP
jgi:hypothetical protein